LTERDGRSKPAAPDLSFVIAFRNEEGFLGQTLDSIAAQEMDDWTAEVLLVDGQSVDGSRALALQYVERSTDRLTFRVLDNAGRDAAAGFNVGIAAARGAVIGFGGAHTVYPRSYFRNALSLLARMPVAVVGGGHTLILPAKPGTFNLAASYLYESALGAKIAPYHRRRYGGFVDTVYGGFYRREIFDRVGMFNTRLVRNQDNEFNARVRAAGYQIYFDPALSTVYVMKTDLASFLRRGYLSGRYHPATWRVNPHAFRFRHAAPGLFVTYLGFVAIATFLHVLSSWWLVPLAAYVVLLVMSALVLAARGKPFGAAFLTIPLFFGFHVAYGFGTLVGLAKLGR